jgi:hypothetical protein
MSMTLAQGVHLQMNCMKAEPIFDEAYGHFRCIEANEEGET